MASLSCHVCGCNDVQLDRVHDGRAEIQLGECTRCEARWTRPVEALAPRRRVVKRPSAALAAASAASFAGGYSNAA